MGKYPSQDDSTTPFFNMPKPDNPPPYSQCEAPMSPTPASPYGPSTSTSPVIGFGIAVPLMGVIASPQPANVGNQQQLKLGQVLLHQSSKEQRNVFLRNVYAILSVQGLIVCGIIALLLFFPSFKTYFEELSWYRFWPCWTFGTIVACFITTLYKLMRKPPINLLLITLVTVSGGVIFGTLSARVQSHETVLVCIGIITAVCLCVVLFTFQPWYHYTPIISTLYVWTLLLIALGVLCLVYEGGIKESLYIMIAPTVVCTYFVMTTQLLVKDKEKALLSNEFVYGAVQVSMYLVAVFAKILYRVYAKCCPCCSCCCNDCGDICDEL